MNRSRTTACFLAAATAMATGILTAPTAGAATIHGCHTGFNCGYTSVAAYNSGNTAFAVDSALARDPHVDHVAASIYAVDVNNEATSFASQGTLIGGPGELICVYLRMGDEQAPGVTTMESVQPVNVVVLGSTQAKADHPCP